MGRVIDRADTSAKIKKVVENLRLGIKPIHSGRVYKIMNLRAVNTLEGMGYRSLRREHMCVSYCFNCTLGGCSDPGCCRCSCVYEDATEMVSPAVLSNRESDRLVHKLLHSLQARGLTRDKV